MLPFGTETLVLTHDAMAEGVHFRLDGGPVGGVERGEIGLRGFPAGLLAAAPPAGAGRGVALGGRFRRGGGGRFLVLLLQVERLHSLGLVVRAPELPAPVDRRDRHLEFPQHLLVEEPEALAGFINENAPYYFVPQYIEFVQTLPYTPTNKVQKYLLREAGVTPTTWKLKGSGYQVKR